MKAKSESINHPKHYGGDTIYETVKVIEAWGLGFCLGNALKYISRAGKKDKAKEIEDLRKAEWYIQRRIIELEKQRLTKGCQQLRIFGIPLYQKINLGVMTINEARAEKGLSPISEVRESWRNSDLVVHGRFEDIGPVGVAANAIYILAKWLKSMFHKRTTHANDLLKRTLHGAHTVRRENPHSARRSAQPVEKGHDSANVDA